MSKFKNGRMPWALCDIGRLCDDRVALPDGSTSTGTSGARLQERKWSGRRRHARWKRRQRQSAGPEPWRQRQTHTARRRGYYQVSKKAHANKCEHGIETKKSKHKSNRQPIHKRTRKGWRRDLCERRRHPYWHDKSELLYEHLEHWLMWQVKLMGTICAKLYPVERAAQRQAAEAEACARAPRGSAVGGCRGLQRPPGRAHQLQKRAPFPQSQAGELRLQVRRRARHRTTPVPKCPLPRAPRPRTGCGDQCPACVSCRVRAPSHGLSARARLCRSHRWHSTRSSSGGRRPYRRRARLARWEGAAVVALEEQVVQVVAAALGRPPCVPVAVAARPARPRLPRRRSGREAGLAEGPVACPQLTCLARWFYAGGSRHIRTQNAAVYLELVFPLTK